MYNKVIPNKNQRNLCQSVIIREKSVLWYHLDHLNSTKAVTGQDGKREALYEYRSFGEELRKLGSGKAKYTYGGKELDSSTNLYYFNARYYDATIGRFINVDPIQDGLNWYVYCNNNPLNRVDPTGLKDPIDPIGFLKRNADNILGLASSAVEIVGGGALLTNPVTAPLGAAMIIHGSCNALASAGKMAYTTAVEYTKGSQAADDADASLPDSALGFVGYGIGSLSEIATGNEGFGFKEKTGAIGDIADLPVSLALGLGKPTGIQKLKQLSSIGDDVAKQTLNTLNNAQKMVTGGEVGEKVLDTASNAANADSFMGNVGKLIED